MQTVTPIKPAIVVDVREPTVDQRVRIRGYLDKHFDDAVGCYLDDMTDQRIAELVGIPRIVVEKMRETAYGPIKVDPVMAGLRAELADLRRHVDGQQKAIDGIKSKLAEVASRVEKATARA